MDEAQAGAALGIPSRQDYGDLSRLPTGKLLDWIVQRHQAERAGLHHDVRLGSPDLGLYSWAARKGLPGPGQKHLAVRQPLHSHDYAGFEGEIAQGYGKGTVEKAEEGKVLLTKVEPNKVHFTVAHKRDPERYVLFKPLGGLGQKEQNWLLMNTTPTATLPFEKPKYKSVPSDKVMPLLEKLQPGSSVQAKVDGALTLTNLLKDKIEVLSYRKSKRHGGPIVHTERVFHTIPDVNVPREYQGSVLSGELYGTQNGQSLPPQALGGLLNASIAKSIPAQEAKNVQLRNQLFDLRRLGRQDISNQMPYEERLGHLRSILGSIGGPGASAVRGQYHLPESASMPQTAVALYRQVASGQHPLTSEGIVIHPSTGTPIKSKLFDEHDVHVREMFPGQGKYEGTGVGGFRYSHAPEGPIAGAVGTGLTDELRRQMHSDPQAFIGRVARVRAQEKFPSGALRAPSLLAMHEDLPLAKTGDADDILFRHPNNEWKPRVRVALPHGVKSYLLEKLNNPRYPQNLGKLRLPGGGVGPGETMSQAAVRELREELGLYASPEMLSYLGQDPRPGLADEHYFRMENHGLKPGLFQDAIGGDSTVQLIAGKPSGRQYMGADLRKLLKQSGAEKAAVEVVHTPWYNPMRMVAETAGRLFNAPMQLALNPTRPMSLLQNPDEARVRAEADVLRSRFPEALSSTKVRLGGTNPIDEIYRTATNKRTSLLGKGLGLLTAPFGLLTSDLMRSDHYNPYSDTINLYSSQPGVASHELGHASDFNQKKPLLRDLYGLSRIPEQAMLNMPGPVSHYQELVANRNALEAAGKQKDPRAIAESKANMWSMMAPAYSTYLSATGLGAAALAGAPITWPIALGTVGGGVLAGHLVAAVRNRLAARSEAAEAEKKKADKKIKTVKQSAHPVEKRTGQAAKIVHPEPTLPQREAGNYRMGHVRMHGLDITIEVAQGQMRRGVGQNGKPWSRKMKCHYGYIKKTKSDADGDHIDVYLGEHPQSELVFVIDQVKKDGSFDEHKTVLGTTSAEMAKDLYLDHVPAHCLGSITPMTMKDFKEWAFNGNTKHPVNKKASLDDLLALPGPEFVSTLPKLASVISSLDDTAGALVGNESLGHQHQAPGAIGLASTPAAAQVQPILAQQPPVPLPHVPPPRPKGPQEPPGPPVPGGPPGAPPGAPGAAPPSPGAPPPGPPGAPPPPPPGAPPPPPAPPPAALPPPGGMPPKLGALLKSAILVAGPRGPMFVPEPGTFGASPEFLIPATSTMVGAGLGGNLSENAPVTGALQGGAQGLAGGLGGVGAAALARHLGAGTGGQVGAGVGGGLLALLLARHLMSESPKKKRPSLEWEE